MRHPWFLKISTLLLLLAAACSDPPADPEPPDAEPPVASRDAAPPDALEVPGVDARPTPDAGPAPDAATNCTLHAITLRQDPAGVLDPLRFPHGTAAGSPSPLYRTLAGTGVGDDRLDTGETVTVDWALVVTSIDIIVGADIDPGARFQVTTSSGTPQTFTIADSPVPARHRVDGSHDAIEIRTIDGDSIRIGQIDYEVCPPDER